MAVAKVTFSLRDYSDEPTKVQFNMPVPSGVAFDWTAYLASIAAVTDEILDLTDCVTDGESVSIEIIPPVGNPASVATAQREIALRFFFTDTAGNKGFLTVPGPEITSYPPQGTDNADMADPDIAALITALEANALSGQGLAITVNRVVLVGRRS